MLLPIHRSHQLPAAADFVRQLLLMLHTTSIVWMYADREGADITDQLIAATAASAPIMHQAFDAQLASGDHLAQSLVYGPDYLFVYAVVRPRTFDLYGHVIIQHHLLMSNHRVRMVLLHMHDEPESGYLKKWSMGFSCMSDPAISVRFPRSGGARVCDETFDHRRLTARRTTTIVNATEMFGHPNGGESGIGRVMRRQTVDATFRTRAVMAQVTLTPPDCMFLRNRRRNAMERLFGRDIAIYRLLADAMGLELEIDLHEFLLRSEQHERFVKTVYEMWPNERVMWRTFTTKRSFV